MSRVSSLGDCHTDRKQGPGETKPQAPAVSLFHIIQQLSACENALWNVLDGLKSNTTHASFFCREYWGSSSSQAQLSLERLKFPERSQRQVQQACVLESLSLAVASHLCSGVMANISVTIRSRLRNLMYYVHENCLVLLDMICQKWQASDLQNSAWQDPASRSGHCPENLNFDILVRVKRYRRLRRGEHIMALRQHNEMITNVVRQLCRGAAPKRAPLSSRGPPSPGDRMRQGSQNSILSVVNDVLTARTPLDRLRASVIRSKMISTMTFRPLLNIDGSDPDCPWPHEDPYPRYGAETFPVDGCTVWFEPLPPMLPALEDFPKLPPLRDPEQYTLVLDLDETLVHYHEHEGMGNYDIRPGMAEFLQRMHKHGYEIVIFTAATQDYADWVIDQIDPGRLIHYRLYRQHALPWGPIFVKDLSKLGRDLNKSLIIDNVQENFMLQPNHGIFIATWYDDPSDTALGALSPLLEELVLTRASVPELLDKYRDQIPGWAGFDSPSYGGEYSEFDIHEEDHFVETNGTHNGHGIHQRQEEQEFVGGQAAYGTMPVAQNLQAGAQLPAQMQAPPSRYQQAPLPQTRPQAGYPTPQPALQQPPARQQLPQQPQLQQHHQQNARQQPQKQQPLPPQQQQQQQPLPPQQTPQQQPQRQAQYPTARQRAPAFSGPAGPYQAAPPVQMASWNRPGMGPCQAPRTGLR